jgi:hypothetical protein
VTTIDLSGARWRKSRHSGAEGNCVEVATGWRKATYSAADNGCVEVGQTPARVVAVRDTTDRDGAMIAVNPAAWRAFTARIRGGEAVQSLTP